MRALNKITFLCALVFFTSTTLAFAQKETVKSVLNKVALFYQNKSQYAVTMNFGLYRGLSGDEKTTSYKGIMERNGSYSKNSSQGNTAYFLKDIKLIVDESNKTITYTNRPKTDLGSPVQILELLQYYDDYQIVDTGSQWLCELVVSKNSKVNTPYGKINLFINKKDYSVSRQELYFSRLIPFKSEKNKESKMDYARLVIDLDHDFNQKIEKKTINDFIDTTDNSFNLRKEWSAYTLVDNTIKNN